MRSAVRIGLLTCLLLSCGFIVAAMAQDPTGNPPAEFETYWMVFLERGDHPPELDKDASAELQRQHLAHLGKLWYDGYSLIAGPFEVPAEEKLRGIVLFRGDLTQDQVAELANADPAVKAGRLKVRVFKWWTGAGVMKFNPPPPPLASSAPQSSN